MLLSLCCLCFWHIHTVTLAALDGPETGGDSSIVIVAGAAAIPTVLIIVVVIVAIMIIICVRSVCQCK